LQRAAKGRHARAAQHGRQAGQQFGHVKGLCQVVVGASVQAGHAVVNIVARGQYQYRQVRQAFAYPA